MPFRGVWYGLLQAFTLGILIIQALGNLMVNLFVHGTIPQEIGGPVRIVKDFSDSGIAEDGWVSILLFAGMLSVNLAIFSTFHMY